MQKIKIVSSPTEEKPFVVIYKPQGLPSAPLKDGDDSALTQAIEIFPQLKNVFGRKLIEHGLLHRIDTQTEGLLLVAASQFFYDNLLSEQSDGKFIKTYNAECITAFDETSNEKNGFPPVDEKLLKELESGKAVRISTYFRNYGEGQKSVRPVTENSGKAALKKLGKQKKYTTEIKLAAKTEFSYFFDCKISSGYRHQVRCHLAWLGFPIIGDRIYNFSEKNTNPEEKMRFKATGLQFTNPVTMNNECFSLDFL